MPTCRFHLRLDRGPEARRGRVGSDDRERCLAVSAVHRVQQVRLLRLGRQSGGRTAALDIDDDQRELERQAQPDRLGFQVETGTGCGRDAEMTGEGCSDRHRDRGDLILGLHGAHPEVLVSRELVQDVGGRGDGIAGQEQREARPHAGRHQADRQGHIAGDVAIGARLQGGGLDHEAVCEDLGRLPEGETGPESAKVGLRHLGPLAELILYPPLASGGGTGEHP